MTTTPICVLPQCKTFKIVTMIHETNFPHSLFGPPEEFYISFLLFLTSYIWGDQNVLTETPNQ